jgi:hypothetical protein
MRHPGFWDLGPLSPNGAQSARRWRPGMANAQSVASANLGRCGAVLFTLARARATIVDVKESKSIKNSEPTGRKIAVIE